MQGFEKLCEELSLSEIANHTGLGSCVLIHLELQVMLSVNYNACDYLFLTFVGKV